MHILSIFFEETWPKTKDIWVYQLWRQGKNIEFLENYYIYLKDSISSKIFLGRFFDGKGLEKIPLKRLFLEIMRVFFFIVKSNKNENKTLFSCLWLLKTEYKIQSKLFFFCSKQKLFDQSLVLSDQKNKDEDYGDQILSYKLSIVHNSVWWFSRDWNLS